MHPNPEALRQFQEKLNVDFTSQELLTQAFVHRSYLNEHRTFPLPHNERLEFLGDAVLELVVTDHLYRTYPNPEGELTALRSSIVKGEMLAEVARKLNFSELLLLSRGEAKSGGRDKGYLLANALEAFLGALYLDRGYAECETFIHQHIIVYLADIIENKTFIDPKSRLQEYTQEKYSVTPNYVVVSETGPDHEKTFTVVVMVGEEELAQGVGGSKQSAQVNAAENALLKAEGSETPV
jgi:ribonuclease III